MSSDKQQLTKEDIKKEIRKENKRYRRKRRGSFLAVMLVLIAIVLLLVYGNNKGLFGGEGFGLGGSEKNSSQSDNSADQESNDGDNTMAEEDNDNDEGEEVVKKNTIVVSEKDITFEGKKMDSVQALKDELLSLDLGDDDVITLKDDKAIMSVYQEVKTMLGEMDKIQFIEE